MSRTTRPSTTKIHPGDAHNRYTQTRCSTTEVQEAKAAAAAKKAEAAAKQAAVVNRIAELENEARNSTKKTDLLANHPRKSVTVPRASRTKNISSVEGQCYSERPDYITYKFATKSDLSQDDKKTSTQNKKYDQVQNTSIDDDGAAGPMSDVEEYVPSGSEFEGGDEDEESEQDMDLEHDEPDTAILTKEKTKAKGTKVKKGLAAREQINTIASRIAPNGAEADRGPNTAENKRKAGPKAVKDGGPKKKAKPPHPAGLVRDWANAAPIQPSPVSVKLTTTPARPVPTGTTRCPTTTPRARAPPENQESEEETPAFEPGGISSDEEEVESFDAAGQSGFQFRSIAKVEDVHVTSSILQRRTRDSNGGQPGVSNLPIDTQKIYTNHVQPMVCNQTGALEAWEHPKDEALLETWNLRVGKHSPHRISKSEMKGELFTTVKHLVKQNGIAVWQNKIATKAKDAVMAEWKIRRLKTVKDRADFALAMLGPNPTDFSKKDRPFLWQSTDESFEAEREGLFQGRMVASTLVYHVMLSASITDGFQVSARPVGALIMSAQAVHRALLYSITGAFDPPDDRDERAFSKANWGDYIEYGPKGDGKLKRRATVFMPEVNALTYEQWDDIIIAALATRERRHVKKRNAEVIEIVDEADDDDMELLVDPRYTVKPEDVETELLTA